MRVYITSCSNFYHFDYQVHYILIFNAYLGDPMLLFDISISDLLNTRTHLNIIWGTQLRGQVDLNARTHFRRKGGVLLRGKNDSVQ